jgi:hypothetical protein
VTRSRNVPTLVVAALVAVGCRATDPAAGSRSPNERRLQSASQGLCDAQVLVSDGNISDAAEVFEERTHTFLHELADQVQDVDRRAAARLLEAKERLEEALADPRGADPGGVAAIITELQRAVSEAASAVHLPTPLCREGAS